MTFDNIFFLPSSNCQYLVEVGGKYVTLPPFYFAIADDNPDLENS